VVASGYRTKREIAVDLLRRAIIRGELAPGTRLVLETLSQQYDLSMTPIREAFPMLEAEGLIVQSPHKGAVVALMDREEIKELYTIRAAIEALATAEAVPNLLDAHLEEMAALLQQMESFQGDWGTFLDFDKHFHLVLYRAAGSQRWLETIGTLWQRSTRYMLASTAASGAIDAIHADHRQLLSACQERDAERAEVILRAHLKYSEQRLLRDWL
jgi:DNA-binding GntR family transcriptional regulator